MTSLSNKNDQGPFYHGTNAALSVGDQLTAGHESNYQSGLIMQHIYFTSFLAGAGLAAQIAADKKGGSLHVYEVVPTGDWEADPNVTDKKFPGNPTHSYRSRQPLTVLRELTDFPIATQAQLTEKFASLQARTLTDEKEILN